MRLSPALSALVVLLAVLLAGCAGSESAPGIAIPDSPVGKQLQWYMGAVKRTPLPESELKEHLSEDFLKGVPAEKFNELAKGLADLKVDELSSTTPTELTGVTSIPLGQKYDMKISVGADGKIDYLLFEPK